ncbi:hypothetical protein ES705_36654 [subsurface metagenome]
MDKTTLLKYISIIACWSGPLYTVVGALVLIFDSHTAIVGWSLIIIGFATFMKPLNDVPLAALLGTIASVVVGVILIAIILVLDVNISAAVAIGLLIGLIILGIIVTLIWKFWLLPLEIISKIVSQPIITVGGIGFCLVLGILALLNVFQ